MGGVFFRGEHRVGGVFFRGEHRVGGVFFRGEHMVGGVFFRGKHRVGGVFFRGKHRVGGVFFRGKHRVVGVVFGVVGTQCQFDFHSYFKFLDWFGLSCYQKLAVDSVAERGVRMKCVGVLSEDHSLLHLHMPYLQHHVRYTSPTPPISHLHVSHAILGRWAGSSWRHPESTVLWRSTSNTAVRPAQSAQGSLCPP